MPPGYQNGAAHWVTEEKHRALSWFLRLPSPGLPKHSSLHFLLKVERGVQDERKLPVYLFEVLERDLSVTLVVLVLRNGRAGNV